VLSHKYYVNIIHDHLHNKNHTKATYTRRGQIASFLRQSRWCIQLPPKYRLPIISVIMTQWYTKCQMWSKCLINTHLNSTGKSK